MSTRLQPPDDDRPPTEQRLLTLGRPIDVRSTSLAMLAVIALIVFLRWAQAILIPITAARNDFVPKVVAAMCLPKRNLIALANAMIEPLYWPSNI